MCYEHTWICVPGPAVTKGQPYDETVTVRLESRKMQDLFCFLFESQTTQMHHNKGERSILRF